MDKETKKYIDLKIRNLIESGNNNFEEIRKDVKRIQIRLNKLERSL